MALSLIIVTGAVANFTWHNTFAESNNGDETYQSVGERFVTFYDDGEKLIVKTDARTVGEALERVSIEVSDSDIVDPGKDTEINADNFFVNIYRSRPVVLKDGKTTRYLMTASHDVHEMAAQAGLAFYDGDEAQLIANDSFLENGVAEVYKIVRNGGRTVTEEEEIAFSERTVKDYNLAPGVSEVRELGETGVKKKVYQVQYVDNVEVKRELVSEETTKEPHERVVAVGASKIEMSPLTPSRGAQRYTYQKPDGSYVTRKETYYDLDMHRVMTNCGGGGVYTVRDDGVKVDKDGYVIIAANLNTYGRCSVVETSLGQAKVYDTGGFASTAEGPEWFDIATDWSNRDGI